jgi:hypothetical protein
VTLRGENKALVPSIVTGRQACERSHATLTRRKAATYPEVTGSKSRFETDGTLPAKTPVTKGKKTKSALRRKEIQMSMDITRGLAVLKAAWSFGSAETAVDNTTAAQISGTDLSGEFLAEAQNYLNMGRHQSAAIMAGDALEEVLRRLSSHNSVAVSSVDGMIAELARKGVYDSLVEQQLSECRNLHEKAVTGLWSEVSKDDVESMLRDLRAFVVDHVSNN